MLSKNIFKFPLKFKKEHLPGTLHLEIFGQRKKNKDFILLALNCDTFFFVLYIFPFYTGYLWLTLLTSPSGLMTNHKSIASSLTAKNTPDIGHGVPPSTELWRSEAIGRGQCYSVHIQIHASIIIIIIMIFYPFLFRN